MICLMLLVYPWILHLFTMYQNILPRKSSSLKWCWNILQISPEQGTICFFFCALPVLMNRIIMQNFYFRNPHSSQSVESGPNLRVNPLKPYHLRWPTYNLEKQLYWYFGEYLFFYFLWFRWNLSSVWFTTRIKSELCLISLTNNWYTYHWNFP